MKKHREPQSSSTGIPASGTPAASGEQAARPSFMQRSDQWAQDGIAAPKRKIWKRHDKGSERWQPQQGHGQGQGSRSARFRTGCDRAGLNVKTRGSVRSRRQGKSQSSSSLAGRSPSTEVECSHS